MSTSGHQQPISAQEYEAPRLEVLGSVHELTLGGGKTFGFSDGFWLNNPDNPIMNMPS